MAIARWLAYRLLPAMLMAGSGAAGAALPVSEVAPGMFVHQGHTEQARSDNGNDIANAGFVVGDDCVAVIDTLGSPALGRQLAASVAHRTDLPICAVINTHVHPDHVLGNRALTGDDRPLFGHEQLPRALAARADGYLAAANRTYVADADTSWIVAPTTTVADTRRIDLGGRTLVLEAWPTAHSNTDLTVFDTGSGTLWTGDLVFIDRMPALDGSINGWLSVLDELSGRSDVKRIVPGHGPACAPWPAGSAPLRRYLSHLRTQVRDAIDQGRTIEQAIANIGYDRAQDWPLFDQVHRRNVTAAFAELEWE
ncbi:quinoprotein relay system zinc metallohydrolase 2 [Salinisphaera sp. P385]|uniref:Quinoprotein relay system zinc metallohydrolase 2 n=1 Tax=Spectribacter acetivorans TaxID=3075603 RepID=A0ABU3B9H5_9GAMM|nr:quinoprotein relay system zinc metallohydrolase 2 [Salinisphaera sp. P385]MDT0619122.1 quinoprotein relay system zinc metallohydrolase 2 [Salinisphaera sp. P385]